MRLIAYRARKGVALALLVAVGAVTPARGATVYTILDLGTLNGWQSDTNGFTAVNASGQVVGDSSTTGYTPVHAFRTAANGAIIPGAAGSDLGTLGGTNSYALGINESGQAVGYAQMTGNTASHAFRTAANGPVIQGVGGSDLGTFGGTSSKAYAINASGQTVGDADTVSGAHHAFRTAANGPIVQGVGGSDLGTLGGAYSFAYGVNASGQVVGEAYTTENSVNNDHAFRTAPNGPIVQGAGGSDLGTLGGASSVAYGINASGQAVGFSYMTGNVSSHAFRTAPNGPIVQGAGGSDLGSLGGKSGYANAINSSGQVVGDATTPGDVALHAFFADVTGPMVDLNALIDPASGWELSQARGINDAGQIAGFGTIGGQTHAYLLTPTPEPASVSLLALGGTALIRRKRRRVGEARKRKQ